MSDPSDTVDPADQLWQLWRQGQRPEVEAFLAAAGPLPVTQVAAVLRVDQRERWQLGERIPAEAYLRRHPDVQADADSAIDLIFSEYLLREQQGEQPSPEEFIRRFPTFADILKSQIDLHRALTTADASIVELQPVPEAHPPTLPGAEFTGQMESTRLAPQEPATHPSRGRGGRQPLEDLQPGQKVDDFDLLTVLGQGGFARVFLARQRSLQRLVALKVSADQGSETQTLAQLDHPHIVRVFDQRVVPELRLRLLYMQYIPGGDLQTILALAERVPVAERTGKTLLDALDRNVARRGELPTLDSLPRRKLLTLSWPETVCWLGARLAEALDYAHQHGVLHRDVKPANVLLTPDGVPLLADFNISFNARQEGADPAAGFGGSLPYMSPEQLEACLPAALTKAAALDGRSDLYSLGVTLWELLTGVRPFPDPPSGWGWTDMLTRMVAQRRARVDAATVGHLPAACPPGLATTLLTCLAARPEERVQSGRELAWQLDLCLQPQARRLLHPPAHSFSQRARRFPVLAVLLATLLPNLLAALVNFTYNRQEIVARLPDALPIFWNVQLAINNLAFPVGIALVALLVLPVARGLRTVSDASQKRSSEERFCEASLTGPPKPADELLPLRRRALKLGHYAAWLSLAEWLVAGVAYPLAMRAAGAALPASAYVHFIVSLSLCGLIAAAYPFFTVTFLCVRALYPALVRPGLADAEEVEELVRLGRLLGFYLLLAASVPLLAVLVLALVGSENRLVLAGLSAGGLLGVSLVFWLFRSIQNDLTALAQALSPPGTGPSSSSTSLKGS